MAHNALWIGCFVLLLVLLPVSALNKGQNYDPQQMFQYLLFSGNAYCDFSSITAWDCPACAMASPTFVPITLVYNSSTNIFSYIGVDGLGTDDIQIIVTFRGTQFDDLANWILNLNFPEAVPYHDFSDCFVHRGFYDAYWSIREGLELWVSQLFSMYPSARLVITGHSLGGAMASICATELGIIYNGQKNISLWTMESPRVGNQKYSELLESMVNVSFRLTNCRDIVPHLPPHDVSFLPFWHPAQEVWLTVLNGTIYQLCDFSGEDPNCSDSLHITLSVYDHLHIMNISTSCPYSNSSSITRESISRMEEKLRTEFLLLQRQKDLSVIAPAK